MEDVNDNAPVFSHSHYSAVVLENVVSGTSVVNLTATDRDLGAGGQVSYELIDQGEAVGMFTFFTVIVHRFIKYSKPNFKL